MSWDRQLCLSHGRDILSVAVTKDSRDAGGAISSRKNLNMIVDQIINGAKRLH